MAVSLSNQTRFHPARWIAIAVVVLCIALLASAVFNFVTLSRLSKSYLSNRGHEIAAALEGMARGPGRRNNPIFWQSVLESNYTRYSGSVAFLSLVDQKGSVLAYKGSTAEVPSVIPTTLRDVYIFNQPLALPRFEHQGNGVVSSWSIRIGLYTTETVSIQRQALLQLAITGMTVFTLVLLAVSLIRTLNRFLEMKAREGAEAQLKSLGIMSASLAHEIRNPLGAMKGLTQLAQEDLPEDHAAQEKLKTVVNEAERLERLVNDLLDFARSKEPKISSFDLVELLTDIKAILGPKLASSKVDLRLTNKGVPMLVRSDPAGLRQILLNVLINAIDATSESQTVELKACLSEDGKTILIQVDDSGKGLGKENPEELFLPFVTKKVRGTGLGLAISRQIAESLGGTLTLESLPGTGARCSITLPIV